MKKKNCPNCQNKEGMPVVSVDRWEEIGDSTKKIIVHEGSCPLCNRKIIN